MLSPRVCTSSLLLGAWLGACSPDEPTKTPSDDDSANANDASPPAEGANDSDDGSSSANDDGDQSGAGSNSANEAPSPLVLQAEDGTFSGEYADSITSPFGGVALYADDDAVNFRVEFPIVPGEYRIDIAGASSDSATATANVLLESEMIGTLSFGSTSRSVQSIDVDVLRGSLSTQTLSIVAVGDDGSWDLFIDQVEVTLLDGASSGSSGSSGSSSDPTMSGSSESDAPTASIGLLSDTPVYESRAYRNLFAESGKTEAEVNAKVDSAVDQLFYGNDNQRIYYESGSDQAYFYTIDTDDVRSEGMSYGMMISVQLDKQEEFDKLWNFSKTHMQHQSGSHTGYFAWQVSTSGSHIDSNPAPDGDEYFAMALLMATNRWGNGSGIYDYEAEANFILDHMLNHASLTGNVGTPSLINPNTNQIIFSTEGSASSFTNPSYHLPHFYELFARWAQKDNDRWRTVASTSRQLFKDACHPTTGLAPDYCQFDGTPTGGEHEAFRFDAWRVAMNIALDSYWWNADPWARDTWVGNYLGFFHDQGVGTYRNQFNIDGSGAQGDHSPGLVAMNATAALISDDEIAWDFVEEFWNTNPTTGQYRYYDGCLYLFGLLNVTGRFQIIGD